MTDSDNASPTETGPVDITAALADAEAVEAGRRGGRNNAIYQALLGGLPPEDQERVAEVVAAYESGADEPSPRPVI